jgi:hypothetical protein
MDVRACLALSLTLLLTAQGALAQVYKWVDADGKVTYGDRPPAGARKVQPLDETNTRLSIVPGMSREEIDRERERGLRQRLQSAEQEIADLRARPPEQVVVQPNYDDFPLYATYPDYPRRAIRDRNRDRERPLVPSHHIPPNKPNVPVVPPPLHGGRSAPNS